MKLKYEAKKRIRIKYRFIGMTCTDKRHRDLYWFYKDHKWMNLGGDGKGIRSSHCSCNSVRAFTRRLKEASKYLPKGVRFELCSRWIGYNVYGETK